VQRNVQLWFDPATDAFRHGAFPAFFLERTGWPTPLYGFPDRGAGVKAALHGFGVSTHPDDLDRAIHEDDVSAVTACLDAWMPGAAGPLRAGKACMYTMTPDGHFVIDRDPRDERIIMAGGFSGHGYKFAAIVGEIVTDLAFDGTTPYAIDFLRATRLRGG
jgi:glycine/D-amino acid oxidase-like deaminating enzyme